MTGLELIMQCAPQVAPVTLAAIVQQESAGRPWSINDNSDNHHYVLTDKASAIALAKQLIRQRHRIDMGLAQINSSNLTWLGVPVERIFDPCTNLRSSQQVLMSAWTKAGGNLGGALQAYNTGRPIGGNYALNVYRQAGVIIPPIPGGRLATWTRKNIAEGGSLDLDARVSLPPVRLKMEWTPEASPLQPRSVADSYGGLR
ncbi:MAG: lytic transglycosylase domain-containing protein [Thiobacillaceae bacterium]